MELTFTKGRNKWEDTRGNIADGMYAMREFDEDTIEDDKPFVKNPPTKQYYHH